eukprot:CAMPEP_0116133850 /NCGR_PEP_ID=MMETSP0329-20121206/10332_1 /TAXON_ID=697910 /ORGANISM="Pseudo-nitzschia arenysensis, Strain B593" /LENGTH=191 /DNA_ID=CAMNT_0003628521 /DNA_START=134 /DNA_END=709 /DNA_ORIENTATION=+
MPDKEFHIKRKLFDLDSDTYKIKCDGVEAYQVRGNGFPNGTLAGIQASFQTMDGEELAVLKEARVGDKKVVPWKNFEWIKDGKVWAHARQSRSYWGMFEKKLIDVDIPGENDYKITGDRLANKFVVLKGNDIAGYIDKSFGFIEHYTVRVKEGADEVDVLLCGILISHVYHTHEVNRTPPKFERESFEGGK